MFELFSGKEIDYDKYPEGSPYSGMQEGGEVITVLTMKCYNRHATTVDG